MNYKKHYNLLIKSRKNRILDKNENYEKHHIKPVSLGGKNEKKNIVHLTYREHFIAHKLLFLFCEGKDKMRMGYALHRLCTINNKKQYYRIKGAREFEKIKKEIYQFIRGKNHPFYGHKWTDKQKKEISVRQMGKGNSMYGKKVWNKGLTKKTDKRLKKAGELYSFKHKNGDIIINRKRSKETRKKISKIHKGIPKSKEHKRKISKSLKGRLLSEETKLKMRQNSQKGKSQKKIKCPYCGKEGGTTMYRWHFEKCKFK